MSADNISTDQADRPRWTQPLRVHLGIAMVLLLIAIAGSLMGFNYWHGRAEAIKEASLRMRDFASRLLDRYHLLADRSIMFTDMAALSDALSKLPPYRMDAKIDQLKSILQRSLETDGAYVGYPNGDALHVVDVQGSPEWQKVLHAPAGTSIAIGLSSVPASGATIAWRFVDHDGRTIGEIPPTPTDFDPRVRPWYQAAIANKGAVVTEPYIMASTGKLGMTIAQSHRADAGIVVGVDIVMDTLSRFLSAQRITPEATTLVLNAGGDLLIESGDDRAIMDGLAAFIRKPRITAKQGQDESLVRARIAGQPFLVEITRVGPDSILAGGRIVVAAPMNELTARADRAMQQHMAISAFILLAGIAMAVVIARRITVSLRLLTAQANDLRRLVLSDTTRVRSRITEIAELGKAMAAARQALRSFGLYVPREIVRAIMSDGQFQNRSAVRRDVTALFTDIKDFTTISEVNSPEDVVTMLSAYFDALNDEIVAHHGALVQFNGDSVFAIWNAPNPDPDHVAQGCACALAMKRAVDVFNAGQRAHGLPEFITRIGVHVGPAVVGSVGAEERLQYTGMGDTINVASRLEGLNKTYGTTILVSEAVAERAGAAFAMRRIDNAQVKGRVEAVTVYELTDAAPEVAATIPSSGGQTVT
ncbi:adenylate/guanylate cyclase domain-containing protein [Segnochrobactrum spirostomi]|nr:adenylate/guanylate cyclase domain-containing protein [Segnochrobactrum spirostomi]